MMQRQAMMQPPYSRDDAMPPFPPAGATQEEWERWFTAKHEQGQRINKARMARLKAIEDNPRSFFTLESFGDEEIATAAGTLQDRRWRELLEMAYDGEKEKLRSQGVVPEQIDGLLEYGWAWKHKGSLIAFRNKSRFARCRPSGAGEALEMLFVFKGIRWVPSLSISALARRHLCVTDPVSVGNAAGSYSKFLLAMICEKRAYADFLFHHGDFECQAVAESQIAHCDKLKEMMEKKGDPYLASSALNVASTEATLGMLSDPEMLEMLIKQHAGVRSRKRDSEGLRELVEKAYLTVCRRTGRAADKKEVSEILVTEHGMVSVADGNQIGGRLLLEREFDNLLKSLREAHKDIYPKRSRAGRPAKTSRG